MKLAIIGAGAISGYVQDQAKARGLEVCALLLREGSAGDLPADTGLVVDCAGHAGLRAHGAAILESGIDLVTLSIGALADEDLANALETAARAGNSRLHLASGAIGALDALRAARVGGLDRVLYRGRKPAAGWRGSPAEEQIDLSRPLIAPVTHFRGTARAAALAYPKNANVAAAVALAGMGFDDTTVELVADPDAQGNSHEIEAKGAFGSLSFSLTGNSLPDNPRSSALAAMSVVASILQLDHPVRF